MTLSKSICSYVAEQTWVTPFEILERFGDSKNIRSAIRACISDGRLRYGLNLRLYRNDE